MPLTFNICIEIWRRSLTRNFTLPDGMLLELNNFLIRKLKQK